MPRIQLPKGMPWSGHFCTRDRGDPTAEREYLREQPEVGQGLNISEDRVHPHEVGKETAPDSDNSTFEWNTRTNAKVQSGRRPVRDQPERLPRCGSFLDHRVLRREISERIADRLAEFVCLHGCFFCSRESGWSGSAAPPRLIFPSIPLGVVLKETASSMHWLKMIATSGSKTTACKVFGRWAPTRRALRHDCLGLHRRFSTQAYEGHLLGWKRSCLLDRVCQQIYDHWWRTFLFHQRPRL